MLTWSGQAWCSLGCAAGLQPVDELLRQPGDDRLALLAQETQHGQPDGQLPPT